MADSVTGKRDAVFALAENMANLKYEQVPPRAAQVVRLDILDTLGVCLAATGTTPACRRLVELVEEMGGRPESTIIGFGAKVPSHLAALANAALAHALNYEDLNDGLVMHAGCIIFPAAFAVAERVGGVNGREFITAYAAGIDLLCRLARALAAREKPRDWISYGWLLPQVLGYTAAAAVAGRLLGLNADQLVSAMGLAYSQVAGSMQPLVGTGADKLMYPAYPAQAGVLSALMALKGIAGPKESLEGKAGLYNVYFQGEYDPAPLTAGLGKTFEGVGFYRYPCCSRTHPSIEVTLRMVTEYGIRPEDVAAVTVSASPRIQDLCEPLEIRRNPRIMSEAQFSLPFTVATAIARGKPRIGHFTAEGIKDPEILGISNRVDWLPDPECAVEFGTGAHPAKIEIKLKDGRVLRAEQRGPRYGHIDRPIGEAELIDKFKDCAAFSVRPLPAGRIEEVIAMVARLEELDDVSPVVRLVS